MHPDVPGRGHQVAQAGAQIGREILDPTGVGFVEIQPVQESIEVSLMVKAGDDPIHCPMETFAKERGVIRQSRLSQQPDGRGMSPFL
jgi:hypothetical protein